MFFECTEIECFLNLQKSNVFSVYRNRIFFQAEDGIRDRSPSRGLGDVYKRQGYEVEPGKVVPFYIKTPKDCLSSGVTRYSESSPWKMGFNVGEDETWMRQYKTIWITIEECLLKKSLDGKPLNNDKYVNPKLITWDGEIRTDFRGTSLEPEDIGSCYATGVLKIGNVYRQGSNYHLQIFFKECKYRERDVIFQSLLSDDEDEGYDTVH